MARFASFKITAFALSLAMAAGCSCTSTPPCKPVQSLPVAAAQPPFLSDSTACSTPIASTLDCRQTEVRGELVYNLGYGIFANSSSITTPGGYAMPKATMRPGGVGLCCNPIPDRDFVLVNRPSQAPADMTVTDDLAALAVAGAANQIPNVIPHTEAVNRPDYSLEKAAPATAFDDQTTSEKYGVVGTVMPEQLVESAPAVAAVQPPVEVVPLAPPAEMVAPANGKEIATAFPREPQSDGNEPVEMMPPVPQVADMDEAVEALLKGDGAASAAQPEALPEVELPPKLE